MDVSGRANFLCDLSLYLTEKPYGIYLPDGVDPKGASLTNLEFEEKDFTVYDIRPNLSGFTLERDGFQVVQHKSQFKDIKSPDELARYRCETEDMLRELFGAETVKCYDACRRKETNQRRETTDLKDRFTGSVPVKRAHVDETVSKGLQTALSHIDAEYAQRQREGRVRIRIINTWRTWTEDLERWPLAMLNYRTLNPAEDLTHVDQVLPSRVVEQYLVKAKHYHRWHWLSKQRSDELTMFMQYDTDTKGSARCCPHTSFENYNAKPDSPVRSSVETRSVVVTCN